MLSVGGMEESVSALSWGASRCSQLVVGATQLVVWESQWVLSVACMGETVGALSWLIYYNGEVSRCSQLNSCKRFLWDNMG